MHSLIGLVLCVLLCSTMVALGDTNARYMVTFEQEVSASERWNNMLATNGTGAHSMHRVKAYGRRLLLELKGNDPYVIVETFNRSYVSFEKDEVVTMQNASDMVHAQFMNATLEAQLLNATLEA